MATNRRRGNILISVLWVVVAMTILVMGLSYEARSDVDRASLVRDRAKAYWMARAAVEQVKFEYSVEQGKLLQAPAGGDDIPDDQKKARYHFNYPEGTVECRIMTNASKMSVNTQNTEQWMQLFSLYGIEEEERKNIVAALLDWRDNDDLPRERDGVEIGEGAEAEYYATRTPAYAPRNGPFFSVEEILLVRGITEDMYYGTRVEGKQVPGLKDLLTVSSQNMYQFDINTCPVGLLMAFLEIDEQEAGKLVKAREEKMLENVQEAIQVINTERSDNLSRFFMTYRGTGQAFTIRATAYVKDSPARYTVEDEVRYIGGTNLFTHISHKDFSLDHVDEMTEESDDER